MPPHGLRFAAFDIRNTSDYMIRTVLFLISLYLAPVVLAANILPAPPNVAATAWLLVDADSGYVIAEHNADEPVPPASLTKLMTSYVLSVELAEGRVSEDDMVLISESAWAQNPVFAGSSLMWIESGKQVKLSDLHRGIVISSGNDATVAVAEHLAGSEAGFAEVMNGHAAELGMYGTNYVNSHGLPHPDHYTTARDLALLAGALITRYPQEYSLYAEREFTYNNIRQYNRNLLLAEDPSVDGLKTGHTKEAGYCLVASAKRDGMRLISVVLGAKSESSRKAESRKLLNYGFRFYATHRLYEAGQQLTESRVWKGLRDQVQLGVGEDIVLTIPRGRHKDVNAVMEVDDTIIAPVDKGASYGAVRISLDDDELLRVDLVAMQAVEQAGFFARLWDHIVMFFTQLIGNV